MVGLIVESKFVRPGNNPRSFLRALAAAGEQLFLPGGKHVNVSHSITAGVPGDRRFALWIARGNRVWIRPENRSGQRCVIR